MWRGCAVHFPQKSLKPLAVIDFSPPVVRILVFWEELIILVGVQVKIPNVLHQVVD